MRRQYKMTKKTNLEEAKKLLFDEHGTNIQLLKYGGYLYRTRTKFKCNICGNIWETFAFSTIDGKGCKKCASKKLGLSMLNPVNYIIDTINNTGCEFIEFKEKYHGNTTKILIKYLCGHENITTFGSFNSSTNICPTCVQKNNNKIITKPINLVIKIISDAGFEFVEFPNGYKNGKSMVSYKCGFGHITIKSINNFYNVSTCRECKKIKMSESQRGNLGYNWKGGTIQLKKFLYKYLKEWKIKIKKECNNKCIISGEIKNLEVHHLYSFTSIMLDALKNLDLSLKSNIGDYSQAEINSLIDEIKKLHEFCPGVCITKKWHIIYHKYYGLHDSIPQQWYEFINRVNLGEITI